MSETIDLRPWGWAPGGYAINCQECPPSPEPRAWNATGAKRSIRCEKHAMEARERSLSTPPPPSLHREPIEADREAVHRRLRAVLLNNAGQTLAGALMDGLDGDSGDDWAGTLYQAVDRLADAAIFEVHRLAFSTPAASDAEGWRPIATAPKDGTQFIGLTKDGRATTMSYREHVKGWKQKENGGWVADGHHMVLCEEDSDSICPRDATHWMPLPATPSTEGRNGEDRADG